jgi:phage baseplate assembly protein W
MSTKIYGRLSSKSIQKDIAVLDKKVYGLNFPLQSNTRGLFSKQSGILLVKNNLTQLLKTERGERVMLPNFGVSLKRFLFEPLTEELFVSIKNEITTSINNYLPNVEIAKLSVVESDTISYNGIQGLIITLIAKLNDFNSSLVEVQVEIN